MGNVWAVCSGSGGVGKTTVTLALSISAAQQGKNVVLLDASGVSRSCDLALGLESVISLDMNDVLSRQAELRAGLYPVPAVPNLRVAAASLVESVPLSELSGVVIALQSMCDVLVIDLPTAQLLPGTDAMSEADCWLIVTRPDDASIRASERMLQLIRSRKPGYEVIVNRSRRDWVRRGTQYSADTIAALLDCMPVAVIPEDDAICACLAKGKGTQILNTSARGAFREILKKLL